MIGLAKIESWVYQFSKEIIMVNRREFIKSTAGAFCALNVSSINHNVFVSSKKKLDRVGLQLYTIRTEMKKDFEGSLAKVAEIGYKEVEFAGYFGRKPGEIAKLLKQLDLDAVAAHISFKDINDQFEKTVEAAKAIGLRYVIIPSWFDRQKYTTKDSLKGFAEILNQAGEKCKSAGIQFGYHNHNHEFKDVDGVIPYDVFVKETDPELVVMEMDLFWIIKGGQNPLDYFKRYPGRFQLCHVKDLDKDQKMVDVGKGNIDFGEIFTKSKQAGLKHYFVEHDNPDDPFASIVLSFKHLQGLEFG